MTFLLPEIVYNKKKLLTFELLSCRKGGILVNNILGVVAALLFLSAPASNSVEMLFLARFLAGLSSGRHIN